MAHRAAPISVSIALGHASANAVKATAVGWSTGSSASLTFPFHSHMSSARREGSEYHCKSLWYDSAGARTYDLLVMRQTLYHWVITLVVHILNSEFPIQYVARYGYVWRPGLQRGLPMPGNSPTVLRHFTTLRGKDRRTVTTLGIER